MMTCPLQLFPIMIGSNLIPPPTLPTAATLACESTAHTSSSGSTRTAYGELSMHRHVLIALSHFQLPTWADTISRFSHCFSTYFNGALDPPYIIASATRSRGHMFVTDVVTLISTPTNAAATNIPSGVTRPLSWPCSCLSSCSHHSPRIDTHPFAV